MRVAILSAVETVNSKLISTLDAAALCKMADREQITGAVLDGPLALDNAIDLGAAQIKKIRSPVAGRANVLVAPDLTAGNILAKSLTFLAGADAAGIVLGARVPIILTSRADARLTRLASCAVASLVAVAERARRVLGLGDDLRPQRRLIEPQGPGLRNRRDRGAARAGILGSVSWAARPGRSPLSTGLPTCRAVPRAAARLPPCRPDHPYGRGTDDRAQRARRTAPDPASTDLTSNGSPRWKR